MKVYILNNGWLEYDGSLMMPLSSLTMQKSKGWKNTWMKIPVFAILIDHPAGKIVYDLSCDPNTMREFWPFDLIPYYRIENPFFLKQLALTGTRPKDVKMVVLSHWHFDPESNLSAFHHADFYIHNKPLGLQQEMAFLPAGCNAYESQAGDDKEITVRHLGEEMRELIPGVEAVTVYHHNFGFLGVMLCLKKQGTLLFLQDVMYLRRYYHPPGKALGKVYETWILFDLVRRIQQYAKQKNAKAMFYDDVNFSLQTEITPRLYE